MESRRALKAVRAPSHRTERGPVRRAPALFVAVGLLLVSLTACSSDPDATCTGAAPAGSASSLISVSGAVGTTPKVSFPTPLNTSKTERSILTPGTGAPLETGQALMADITIYNGTTGALVPRSQYGAGEGTLPLTIGQAVAGLSKGLICAKSGSRVAIAVSPKDGVNDSATSLVVVVDVRRAFLPRADGVQQPHVAGMPQVVLAPNGEPGITVPKTTAPAALQVVDLKKGNGAVVKRGARVVVQYTGVLWNDGTVFDSSWSKTGATTMVADDGSSGSSSGGVISGFADALIGQRVGSQVLAVIPPDKAYGAQGSGTIPANATLVFVVDVLGIQ